MQTSEPAFERIKLFDRMGSANKENCAVSRDKTYSLDTLFLFHSRVLNFSSHLCLRGMESFCNFELI